MKTMVWVILLLGLAVVAGCATTDSDEASSAQTSSARGGDTSDDGAIASAIETAFQQDELLNTADIDVSTDQGVVTLSGSVSSPQAFNRAISLARRVPGVRPPVIVSNLVYTR